MIRRARILKQLQVAKDLIKLLQLGIKLKPLALKHLDNSRRILSPKSALLSGINLAHQATGHQRLQDNINSYPFNPGPRGNRLHRSRPKFEAGKINGRLLGSETQ